MKMNQKEIEAELEREIHENQQPNRRTRRAVNPSRNY
jgi:hypothetical protein